MFGRGGKAQKQVGGDQSVLIQAGRDAVLAITKSPPSIKLVKLTINNDDEGRHKLSIVIKNNGDMTAVLLNGHLIVEAREKITDCNFPDYSLMHSDWTYDVDLDAPAPQFVGRHAIAPNEVVSFDVVAARATGGPETTVYKCRLELVFDEGLPLETGHFFLELSGPVVPRGSYTHGVEPEVWGMCMADNIRRLDAIGFDFRPMIDTDALTHIAKVAPELFPNAGK